MTELFVSQRKSFKEMSILHTVMCKSNESKFQDQNIAKFSINFSQHLHD